MTKTNLAKLLDKLDKTAYRLELETEQRDALIHELIDIHHVPARTVARAARTSHQTAINIANRYKEQHQ